MAYDESSSVVVLFGGESEQGYTSETWQYDVSADTWTNMQPQRTPRARMGSAMAHDRENGVVVLFGGYGTNGQMNDTWTYNGTTNMWSQKFPATSPPNRSSHGMVYDSANRKMVLFGGGGIWNLNDTWTYDLLTNSWTDMNPSTTPNPRYLHAMAYDESAGTVVLFGGATANQQSCGDTWSYNLSANTWSDLQPALHPEPRGGHGMVYDSRLGEVVLFGGAVFGGSPTYKDTWSYSSSKNKWTDRSPSSGPPEKYNIGAAFDNRVNATVIFGDHRDNDTWLYQSIYSETGGTFTSLPFDCGGNAYFGHFRWNASTSSNTTVRFQVRTAGTRYGLACIPFIGPGGTGASFYETSGQRVRTGHNGSRWLQYKAYLATTNAFEKPVLRAVEIEYNLLHAIALISPTGGECWSGKHNLTWTALDPDNDSLYFDIYLLHGTDATLLASNLTGEGWEWDTSTVWRGDFRIRVVARDGNSNIPLNASATSGDIQVFNNRRPTATLVSPVDGSIVGPRTTLVWTGEDSDGDDLTYNVYISDSPFDSTSLPRPTTIIKATFHVVHGFSEGSSCYWTVKPDDGVESGIPPPAWHFRVNQVPGISLISPDDGALLNSTDVTLTWNGTDEDAEALTYDLSWSDRDFDQSPPRAIHTNATWHELTGLQDNTTYYWAVTPHDGLGTGERSAIWRFKVALNPPPVNHDPLFTSSPPVRISAGMKYSYNVTASDPDGDPLVYSLVRCPDGMLIDGSSGSILWTPRPDQIGNHATTVKVTDGRGGEAVQSHVIEVVEESRVRPTCAITHPRANETVRGKINVTGTATKGSFSILRVNVLVDHEILLKARGTRNWSLELDTTGLSNGEHVMEAWAEDAEWESDVARVTFSVNNMPKGPTIGMDAWPSIVLSIMAIAIVAAAASKILLMRRRRDEGS